MLVSKQLTINIGQYQSVRISVAEAPSFEEADQVIIGELERLQLPVNENIKQCLKWNQPESLDDEKE